MGILSYVVNIKNRDNAPIETIGRDVHIYIETFLGWEIIRALCPDILPSYKLLVSTAL